MSIVTLILGESGTGKTTSLHRFDPADTLLIQAFAKPLPFKTRGTGWGIRNADNPGGNIFVEENASRIAAIIQRTQRKVIVIDDFQYIMVSEFMRRSGEPNPFQKFADIGKNIWDLLNVAAALPPDVRVYVLSHTNTDDAGITRIKTVGKMLDEKIVIEGMVSIVLRTSAQGGEYKFHTQNSGSDTVKTPMGLFADTAIDNDLAEVDKAICDYFDIAVSAQDAEPTDPAPPARRTGRKPPEARQ